MALTAAEKQKAYRERQKGNVSGNGNAPVTVAGNALDDVGPFDVYSESRWEFLRSRGYEWDAGRRRGVRLDSRQPNGYVVGVVVPGDPGYERN